MPKVIERRLRAEAKRHGFKPESTRYNRYVYGTLARLGREKRDVPAKRRARKRGARKRL